MLFIVDTASLNCDNSLTHAPVCISTVYVQNDKLAVKADFHLVLVQF
jgi:hypothetical protein